MCLYQGDIWGNGAHLPYLTVRSVSGASLTFSSFPVCHLLTQLSHQTCILVDKNEPSVVLEGM